LLSLAVLSVAAANATARPFASLDPPRFFSSSFSPKSDDAFAPSAERGLGADDDDGDESGKTPEEALNDAVRGLASIVEASPPALPPPPPPPPTLLVDATLTSSLPAFWNRWTRLIVE
jgi:hypothetical protein